MNLIGIVSIFCFVCSGMKSMNEHIENFQCSLRKEFVGLRTANRAFVIPKRDRNKSEHISLALNSASMLQYNSKYSNFLYRHLLQMTRKLKHKANPSTSWTKKKEEITYLCCRKMMPSYGNLLSYWQKYW